MKKITFVMSVILCLTLFLSGCGKKVNETKDTNHAKTEYSAAMVTDTGGVDDKSFNQSAWEGLQAYAEENGLEKGVNGINYLASKSDADYIPNLKQLADSYKLVFGIGYLMDKAVQEVAEQNPDVHFAIVDYVYDKIPANVACISFKEHEGSFLVGVVAAMKSKSKHVGFIGGMDTSLIHKFEAGFKAGVKAVDSTIKVDTNYTGSFSDAALGQASAATMYKSGVDVIYHASGGCGVGVFTEAKNIKENDMSKDVWVIGVDKDQVAEGLLKDGKTNVTLTSMVKRVDVGVKDVCDKGKTGQFPAAQMMEYGLENNGVGIAPTQDNLTPEILKAVEDYTAKIKSKEIVVPSE